MTREEALEVLGLSEGASEAHIRGAWKRLLMAVHPDKGGTDLFARMANTAKETLLGERPEAAPREKERRAAPHNPYDHTAGESPYCPHCGKSRPVWTSTVVREFIAYGECDCPMSQGFPDNRGYVKHGYWWPSQKARGSYNFWLAGCWIWCFVFLFLIDTVPRQSPLALLFCFASVCCFLSPFGYRAWLMHKHGRSAWKGTPLAKAPKYWSNLVPIALVMALLIGALWFVNKDAREYAIHERCGRQAKTNAERLKCNDLYWTDGVGREWRRRTKQCSDRRLGFADEIDCLLKPTLR